MKTTAVYCCGIVMLAVGMAEKTSSAGEPRDDAQGRIVAKEGAERAPPATPTLHGDGAGDDTEAIQALLDRGRSNVYLPPPKRNYLISKTLRIHSNQSLTLDRFTVIRLADKSDCTMITNDDHVKGNENIAIVGGVWDGNNMGQPPNPLVTGRLRGNSQYDA